MRNLLLLTFLIFTGCSVTHAPISEYRIAPEVKPILHSAESCKAKSLKISQVFSSSSLKSKKMKYAQENYKEFSFSESEWADAPNKAITKELVKSVRATELFSNVTCFKSRSKSEMILETSVEDFMQYFSDDNSKSYVNVVMTTSLIDTRSSKSIQTKTFEKKLEVETLSAQGGVDTLNSAFASVLEEHSLWLEGVCK